jgi:CO/xanthine dehydrogenase Mo-binding subunit
MDHPPSHEHAPSPIGVSVPRRDAVAKVTGRARYTGDFSLPGMCHARLLRSPHPHARIRSIDVTAARRAPGVVAVVTAADLTDVELFFGHAVRDHPLIAVDTVRYAGEPVVGVVAESVLEADQALELIEVDYEPLPFVTDVEAALAPDAPAVHAAAAERGVYSGVREAIEEAHPNLCTRTDHVWGDIQAAFTDAALVIEGTYEYPMAYAYAMEPYTTLATFDEDGLTVMTAAQHPSIIQSELARCFHLPMSSVRVVIPLIGGAFGSKDYIKIEPLTAALALRAGRPVRLALSIDESIVTGRSIPTRIRLRSAFNGDGTLRGREATVLLNAGAYAENAPRTGGRATRRLGGPYRIPALNVEAISVYTNTAPNASYRGLGAPQAVWAGESQMDEAAERLGIDPVELRRRNLLQRHERAWPGARGMDADLGDDLRIVSEAIGWDDALPAGHGLGIAVGAADAGAEPTSSAIVRVLSDGSVMVFTGSTEFGQGSATVLAQIAAGELGVPVERVRLFHSDTALASYDRGTGASRTTPIMGLAIQRAAMDARSQMVGWARQLYALDGPEVIEGFDGVTVGDTQYSWSRVIQDWFGPGSGESIGRGYVRRDGETAELPLFWEVAFGGLEVSVDEETGEVRPHRMVTVADIGLAVNPLMAEGQDRGAAMMGLGVAMREELVYDDGILQNGNLFDYRVPRTTDLPELQSILAERRDGVGPYGIKGGGEGSLNPIAPALANAVFRATGVRMRTAPLSPERVWRALRERE